MINFNLQHFAQVIDEFGDELERKKRQIKPVIKPKPVQVQATRNITPTLEPKPVEPVKEKLDPVGTGNNQMPDFLKTSPEQEAQNVERRKRLKARAERESGKVETDDEEKEPVETSQDIASRLAEAKKQRQLAQLRTAFDKAVGAQEQRLEQIPGEFREAQTQVRTRGDLAQTGLEKISAIGATGAGSLAQSSVAQNVITQGAESSLTQQEIQAKNDIKNRIAELEVDFASGTADINMQAEAEELQRTLDAISAKEQQALKQAEIQDQRDYDLFLRNLDNLDQRELIQFENSLKQENTILDAEIAEARANNDFARAQVLEEQKSANNLKLQGMRDANAMARVGASTAGNLAAIEARGLQDRATAEFKDVLDSSSGNNDYKPPYTSIKSGLTAAIGDTELKTPEEIKADTFSWIKANEDIFFNDPDSFRRLFVELPYSAQEFEQYENLLEQRLREGVTFQ